MENGEACPPVLVGFSVQYFPTCPHQRLALLIHNRLQTPARVLPLGSAFWFSSFRLPAGEYRWKWVVLDSSGCIQRVEERGDRLLEVKDRGLVVSAVWGHHEYHVYPPDDVVDDPEYPLRVFIHDLPLDYMERLAVTGSSNTNNWSLDHHLFSRDIRVLEIFIRREEILSARWTTFDAGSGSVFWRAEQTGMRSPQFPVVVDSYWRLCGAVKEPRMQANGDKSVYTVTFHAPGPSSQRSRLESECDQTSADPDRLEAIVQHELKARSIVLSAVKRAVQTVAKDANYEHRRESDLKLLGLTEKELGPQDITTRPMKRAYSAQQVSKPEVRIHTSGSQQSLAPGSEMYRPRGFMQLPLASDSEPIRRSRESVESSNPTLYEVLDVNGNTMLEGPQIPDFGQQHYLHLPRTSIDVLSGEESGEEYTRSNIDEELDRLQDLDFIDLIRQEDVTQENSSSAGSNLWERRRRHSLEEGEDAVLTECTEAATLNTLADETLRIEPMTYLMEEDGGVIESPSPTRLRRFDLPDPRADDTTYYKPGVQVCKVYPFSGSAPLAVPETTTSPNGNPGNSGLPNRPEIRRNRYVYPRNGTNAVDEHFEIRNMLHLLRQELGRLENRLSLDGDVENIVANTIPILTPPGDGSGNQNELNYEMPRVLDGLSFEDPDLPYEEDIRYEIPETRTVLETIEPLKIEFLIQDDTEFLTGDSLETMIGREINARKIVLIAVIRALETVERDENYLHPRESDLEYLGVTEQDFSRLKSSIRVRRSVSEDITDYVEPKLAHAQLPKKRELRKKNSIQPFIDLPPRLLSESESEISPHQENLEVLVQHELDAQKLVVDSVNQALNTVSNDEEYQHRRDSDLQYLGLEESALDKPSKKSILKSRGSDERVESTSSHVQFSENVEEIEEEIMAPVSTQRSLSLDSISEEEEVSQNPDHLKTMIQHEMNARKIVAEDTNYRNRRESDRDYLGLSEKDMDSSTSKREFTPETEELIDASTLEQFTEISLPEKSRRDNFENPTPRTRKISFERLRFEAEAQLEAEKFRALKEDPDHLETMIQHEKNAREIVLNAIKLAIQTVARDVNYQHRRESDREYLGLSENVLNQLTEESDSNSEQDQVNESDSESEVEEENIPVKERIRRFEVQAAPIIMMKPQSQKLPPVDETDGDIPNSLEKIGEYDHEKPMSYVLESSNLAAPTSEMEEFVNSTVACPAQFSEVPLTENFDASSRASAPSAERLRFESELRSIDSEYREDPDRLENIVQHEIDARKIVLRAIKNAIEFLQNDGDYSHRRGSDLDYLDLCEKDIEDIHTNMDNQETRVSRNSEEFSYEEYIAEVSSCDEAEHEDPDGSFGIVNAAFEDYDDENDAEFFDETNNFEGNIDETDNFEGNFDEIRKHYDEQLAKEKELMTGGVGFENAAFQDSDDKFEDQENEIEEDESNSEQSSPNFVYTNFPQNIDAYKYPDSKLIKDKNEVEILQDTAPSQVYTSFPMGQSFDADKMRDELLTGMYEMSTEFVEDASSVERSDAEESYGIDLSTILEESEPEEEEQMHDFLSDSDEEYYSSDEEDFRLKRTNNFTDLTCLEAMMLNSEENVGGGEDFSPEFGDDKLEDEDFEKEEFENLNELNRSSSLQDLMDLYFGENAKPRVDRSFSYPGPDKSVDVSVSEVDNQSDASTVVDDDEKPEKEPEQLLDYYMSLSEEPKNIRRAVSLGSLENILSVNVDRRKSWLEELETNVLGQNRLYEVPSVGDLSDPRNLLQSVTSNLESSSKKFGSSIQILVSKDDDRKFELDELVFIEFPDIDVPSRKQSNTLMNTSLGSSFESITFVQFGQRLFRTSSSVTIEEDLPDINIQSDPFRRTPTNLSESEFIRKENPDRNPVSEMENDVSDISAKITNAISQARALNGTNSPNMKFRNNLLADENTKEEEAELDPAKKNAREYIQRQNSPNGNSYLSSLRNQLTERSNSNSDQDANESDLESEAEEEKIPVKERIRRFESQADSVLPSSPEKLDEYDPDKPRRSVGKLPSSIMTIFSRSDDVGPKQFHFQETSDRPVKNLDPVEIDVGNPSPIEIIRLLNAANKASKDEVISQSSETPKEATFTSRISGQSQDTPVEEGQEIETVDIPPLQLGIAFDDGDSEEDVPNVLDVSFAEDEDSEFGEAEMHSPSHSQQCSPRQYAYRIQCASGQGDFIHGSEDILGGEPRDLKDDYETSEFHSPSHSQQCSPRQYAYRIQSTSSSRDYTQALELDDQHRGFEADYETSELQSPSHSQQCSPRQYAFRIPSTSNRQDYVRGSERNLEFEEGPENTAFHGPSHSKQYSPRQYAYRSCPEWSGQPHFGEENGRFEEEYETSKFHSPSHAQQCSPRLYAYRGRTDPSDVASHSIEESEKYYHGNLRHHVVEYEPELPSPPSYRSPRGQYANQISSDGRRTGRCKDEDFGTTELHDPSHSQQCSPRQYACRSRTSRTSRADSYVPRDSSGSYVNFGSSIEYPEMETTGFHSPSQYQQCSPRHYAYRSRGSNSQSRLERKSHLYSETDDVFDSDLDSPFASPRDARTLNRNSEHLYQPKPFVSVSVGQSNVSLASNLSGNSTVTEPIPRLNLDFVDGGVDGDKVSPRFGLKRMTSRRRRAPVSPNLVETTSFPSHVFNHYTSSILDSSSEMANSLRRDSRMDQSFRDSPRTIDSSFGSRQQLVDYNFAPMSPRDGNFRPETRDNNFRPIPPSDFRPQSAALVDHRGTPDRLSRISRNGSLIFNFPSVERLSYARNVDFRSGSFVNAGAKV